MKLWIRYVQELNFMEELRYLRNESKTSPAPNIRNLGLYVDDNGLLKCKGRLNNAPIRETEKRPILCPPNTILRNWSLGKYTEKLCTVE